MAKIGNAAGLNQSVVAAMRILETLAEQGPLGVTAMARHLGIPKARSHRHLKTLSATGFVTQDSETDRYRIGVKFWIVGRSVAWQFDYLKAVQAIVPGLRDELGHTVVVGIVDDDHVVAIETFQGTSDVKINVLPGTRFDLHTSALGKVALAFGDDTLLERTLARTLVRQTPRTKIAPAEIRKEVESIRHCGWGANPDESVVGFNALAAPVFQAGGSLVGVICAVDSLQYLPATPSPQQIKRVMETAARLSRELGHTP